MARENGHVREGIGADRPAPPGSGREREIKHTQEGADRRGPPVREV